MRLKASSEKNIRMYARRSTREKEKEGSRETERKQARANVCACVHFHVCITIHMHIHVHTHTHTYTQMPTCTRTRTQSHTHTHTHTHTRTRTHTYLDGVGSLDEWATKKPPYATLVWKKSPSPTKRNPWAVPEARQTHTKMSMYLCFKWICMYVYMCCHRIPFLAPRWKYLLSNWPISKGMLIHKRFCFVWLCPPFLHTQWSTSIPPWLDFLQNYFSSYSSVYRPLSKFITQTCFP